MIKHAEQMRISQIFSENFVYSIPKYQRGYSWTTKHWERMFDDLIENEKGYFFGTVICVLNEKTNLDKYVEFELIDGQQRFTTLSILLLSVYNHLCKYIQKIRDNENEYENFIMLKKEFVYKDVPRVQLQIQENNQDDYYYYLYENNIISCVTQPEKLKSRRISKAYRYFYDRITRYLREIDDSDERDNVEKLFDLVEKINSSVIVKIQVDSHADAYTLFEALNNAGMPLSGIDLIKNSLIAEASKHYEEDKVYRKWCEIINNIGDDYATQIRFFCYFYDAFVEEINMPYRNEKVKYYFGQKATRTNMLSIYEKLIKEDYDMYLEKIYQSSKMFAILTNNTDYGEFYDLKNELLKLERVQGASGYILLLNLFINKDKYELNNEMLRDIIESIIDFFVRRNLTNYPDTGALINIFMKITNEIVDKKRHDIVESIYNSFYDIFSDRDKNEFKNALLGKVYDINGLMTRFLLCYYEKDHETKEKFIDLWERNGNNYIWTIEHIFPEGERIPKEWVDMIGDGDMDKTLRVHDKYVHCFGNLTMTGYNSNLSNKSFEEKKNLKDSRGNNIGYNNGLFMNEEIYKKSEWKEEDIVSRTNKLAKYFFEQYDIMGISWDELNEINNKNDDTFDWISKKNNVIFDEYDNNEEIMQKEKEYFDAKQKYIYKNNIKESTKKDDEKYIEKPFENKRENIVNIDENVVIDIKQQYKIVKEKINDVKRLDNIEFINPGELFDFEVWAWYEDKYGEVRKRQPSYKFSDKISIISSQIFDKYIIKNMQKMHPDEKIIIRDFNFKVCDLKRENKIKLY